jgi:DNA polymerase III delta prime subunit
MDAATLAARLDEARRGLLDLSTRNRLLALPKPGRSRGVVLLEEEDADVVFAGLVAGKAFGFEAAGEAPPPAPDAPKPRRRRRAAKAEGVSVASAAKTREAWRADALLRARATPEELTRRLRDLMADARIAREETGVATLSLGLGTLAWRDPGTPGTERLAPLALLPVVLQREGISESFRLRAAGLEVQENLSLREKLAAEFRIALPDFDAEEYDPTRWAEAVAAAIGAQEGWRVEADGLALGLFSFAKFLMWRDLDPAANPGLLEHPVVRALVGGEALAAPPPFPDDADVDAEIRVERLDHVMEVDGSQALAAEAVRRGGHVVIQGPPGTGKSQTIANIIAQAVLDRRTVLFVAEKLAALEVVQRRLGSIGLGAACLELHSEKQSKRAVLDELRATLALPTPPKPEREALIRRLGALRARLNGHAAAMAGEVGASGRPLHAVVGNLVALRAAEVKAPDFALPAAGWDATRIAEARAAAEELAARAAEGGWAFPLGSPWRGVTKALPPTDQERLLGRLPALIRAIAAGAAALAPVAAALGRPPPGPRAAREVLALSRVVASAPAHDPAAMAHPAWAADPAPLRALARAARDVAAVERDRRLQPGALEVTGIAEARAALAESGGILGFLSGAQRAAKAVASRVATDASDPLPALDAALAGQAALRALRAGEVLGRGAFGMLWGGEPAALEALVAWREASGAGAAAALAKRPPAPNEAAVAAALEACEELAEATGLTEELPLADLAARLGDWAAAPEGLPLWLGWQRTVAEAGEALAPLAERLADGRLAPEAAPQAFDFALDEALLKAAMRARPELAAFDGGAFDRLVADFAEADRARIELTRREAAFAHAEALARVRAGLPGHELLKGEFEKKRGHLPVRELLLRAPRAIQAAKPVFMMSPLSVAQFLAPPHGLKPGSTFDLLVIDEASQIEPVDALGAIARCRQVVVVGDDRQMPPTRFFQRMTSEEEGEEEHGEGPVAAREVESILGLANARGVPNVMLRWHYRSRHESLIATSNAEFYEGRLLILPSPRARSPRLGLSLVRVDGRWEAGAGVNRVEAEAVAQAVMQHARETPGGSLGVAAFSIRQRDAILDAVEALRRGSPETEAFFAAHEHEPFFVKNLENVQGDERDTILISVGYARGADGKVAMRFGPLSADGGERRLNVLITRAKKRCVVFSGLAADDIDLERASGRGVAAFKAFLRFAAGGEDRRAGGEAAAAPLARVIAREVEAAGRQAAARIGTSGLFLDVAAREGEEFVLGVEADAGDWAAVRAARDRERGRPAALSMMGWRLHRAWSLAWLQRPEAERARLRAALGVAAQAAPGQGAAQAAPGQGAAQAAPGQGEAEAAPEPKHAVPDPGLAQPYAEAAVEVPRDTAIPEVPFAKLSEILAAIIRAEQPVHADAVLERARILRGRDRLEAADRAALQQALRLAAQLQGVAERGGFWSAEDAPAPTPRDRRAAAPHLRRAAMVAPAEIEAACRVLLGVARVATEEELAAGVTRLLGLEANQSAAVAARVAALVGAGRVALHS